MDILHGCSGVMCNIFELSDGNGKYCTLVCLSEGNIRVRRSGEKCEKVLYFNEGVHWRACVGVVCKISYISLAKRKTAIIWRVDKVRLMRHSKWRFIQMFATKLRFDAGLLLVGPTRGLGKNISITFFFIFQLIYKLRP